MNFARNAGFGRRGTVTGPDGEPRTAGAIALGIEMLNEKDALVDPLGMCNTPILIEDTLSRH